VFMQKIHAGYTLIELSVVLVIISLLTAGGLTLGAGMVNQAAHIDTKKILNQIDQSLRDYYTVNGRLPCPASRDLAITHADFGREVNGGVCTGTGAISGTSYSNDVRIGMIPVRALGLSDRAASDKYGNRILYAVTRQLTDASTFGGDDGAIQVLPATGGAILDDAAYFVWSAGKDHKGAPLYTTGAIPTACAGVALDAENCDNDNIFRDAPFNNGEVVANFFDDHTRWAPKFHLAAMTAASDTLWSSNAGDSYVFSVGTDGQTSNTDVGIGTSTPEEKLEVTGRVLSTSNVAGFFFRDRDEGVNDNWAWYSDDNVARFWRWGLGDVIGVKSDGFVGIGTMDPQERLQVNGNVNVEQGSLSVRGTSSTIFMRDTNARSAMVHVNDDKYYVLRANGTDSAVWDTSRPFVIDFDTNNIGLGTLTPSAKLDISATGDGAEILRLGAERAWQFEQRGSGAASTMVFRSDAGNKDFDIRNADNETVARFYAASTIGSSYVHMAPEGGRAFVGPRTTSHSKTRLLVTAPVHNQVKEDWFSDWGGGIATWDVVGASTLMDQNRIRSDRQLKNNISYMSRTDMVEALRELRPATYTWKDPYLSSKTQYGFIAQDVLEIWPDLIEGEGSKEAPYSLNYDGLIAPTVLAVQVLLDRQDAMAAEIEALKAGGSGMDKPDVPRDLSLMLMALLLGITGTLLVITTRRNKH